MRKLPITLGLIGTCLLQSVFAISFVPAWIAYRADNQAMLLVGKIQKKYEKALILLDKGADTIKKDDIVSLITTPGSQRTTSVSNCEQVHAYITGIDIDIDTVNSAIQDKSVLQHVRLTSAITDATRTSLEKLKSQLEGWQQTVFKLFAFEFLIQEGRVTRSNQNKLTIKNVASSAVFAYLIATLTTSITLGIAVKIATETDLSLRAMNIVYEHIKTNALDDTGRHLDPKIMVQGAANFYQAVQAEIQNRKTNASNKSDVKITDLPTDSATNSKS